MLVAWSRPERMLFGEIGFGMVALEVTDLTQINPYTEELSAIYDQIQLQVRRPSSRLMKILAS
jgi:hypothetical protein